MNLGALASTILSMVLAASNVVATVEGSSVQSTVVVGLNAAFQKRFILPPGRVLIPGDVHRATEVQVGVGGKGQDVVIALSCLKYSDPIKLAQFIGTDSAGDTVYHLLRQTLSRTSTSSTNNDNNNDMDIFDCTVRSKAPLRTCTSIVADDATTELVEPSGTISSPEYEELFARLSRVQADALCFMGSLPPGCPDDTYARIYETFVTQIRYEEEEDQEQQKMLDGGSEALPESPLLLCLIDSVAGLESLLTTIGQNSIAKRRSLRRRCQTMLKINASEFCRLSGVVVTAETGGIKPEELFAAVHALFQQWPNARNALDAIAISDGCKSLGQCILFILFLLLIFSLCMYRQH